MREEEEEEEEALVLLRVVRVQSTVPHYNSAAGLRPEDLYTNQEQKTVS